MKKIIRLTENDLVRLIKRVIMEEDDNTLLNNIKGELTNLGFKYYSEDQRHVLKYKEGENIITVGVSTNPMESRPYSVVSILLKPNYEANPGYERSRFDRTYTDIGEEGGPKRYASDQYKLLLNDVKTSMKKITRA